MTGFHPLIASWFRQTVGEPTPVQAAAWPRIAAGEHVLVTAPTGSGKTLTAFLWALHQLATAEWPVGETTVLYVSPLKALNNDIRRNLLNPLAGLRQAFAEAGCELPDIRVATRSGDTPQHERRAMLRHPPEILITTPESLNILLTSQSGQRLLRSLRTVILDEIHAVLGAKRGVHLISAIERLVPLAGEFQRLALSATVHPLAEAAAFVGGYRWSPGPRYQAREVAIVQSPTRKQYDVSVWFPAAAARDPDDDSIWPEVVRRCRQEILQRRSTLIFVRTRSRCEKLTRLLNEDADEPLAYSHHGALSKELRAEVESRMKEGRLRAIVATSSLELGIDIGALEAVILVQSPDSTAAAVQRLGRAGHQVGAVSHGLLIPTWAGDILEAAVLGSGIDQQQLEPVRTVKAPLDVLAQIIISICAHQTWQVEQLYQQLRCSYAYHQLSRRHFDLVIEMLAGRYADTRIRDLQPRLSWDRLDGTVTVRKGATLALYLNGGTIPDRGYFRLRHQQTNAVIGELDEEFVWESTPGKHFVFGNRTWRIESITHNDVLVSPSSPEQALAPFWRGEVMNRDAHFSTRIAEFLAIAEQRLRDPGWPNELQSHCGLTEDAAGELVAFLQRQRQATGTPLPHRHHLLIEQVGTGPGGAPGARQLILHTLWGGQVNRPYALALQAAWHERYGDAPDTFAADNCIYLVTDDIPPPAELLSLVTSATVEQLLRQQLEGSDYFGARFREAAGRALLLPKPGRGQRLPLWLSRIRSQKLLDAVRQLSDFPILLEAWRTCLQDEFDLDILRQRLAELESGAITWSETRLHSPSPLAWSHAWRQVNSYMYKDDTPRGQTRSNLSDNLLRDVVFSPDWRPLLPPDLVHRFQQKRQRLAPGYAPDDPTDLLDWLKERLLLPPGEWQDLLTAAQLDGLPDDKLTILPDQRVAAAELTPLLQTHWFGPEPDPETFLDSFAQWISYYGPLTPDRILDLTGLPQARLHHALDDLADSGRLVRGALTIDGPPDEVCDADNLEILLRLKRAEAVPDFQPLPITQLPRFLADTQGLTQPPAEDALAHRLEQLSGRDLRAELWEQEVLPARLPDYDPAQLDALMQAEELLWLGRGSKRLCFLWPDDLDLILEETPDQELPAELAPLLPKDGARYPFASLAVETDRPASELNDALWAAAWNGQLTTDAFLSVRQGLATRFQPPTPASRAPGSRQRRGRRTAPRWRRGALLPGNWFRVPIPQFDDNPLDRDQRDRDRVRLLLDRYGLLCRQLLDREPPPFRWGRLFRAMRLMELSGELLAGSFFDGITGLQFLSPASFQRLRQHRDDDHRIWWVNAADPASLCGVDLPDLKQDLPTRLPGNHLVYRGSELQLISERQGRKLTFLAPPDAPWLSDLLIIIHHLLGRRVAPRRRLTIETINGQPASRSPYTQAIRQPFDASQDGDALTLYRQW